MTGDVAPQGAETAGDGMDAGDQGSEADTGERGAADGAIRFLIGRAGEPRMALCGICGEEFGPVRPFIWRGRPIMPGMCDACSERLRAAEEDRHLAADKDRLNLPARAEYREANLERFRVISPSQRQALDTVTDMAAAWRLSGHLPAGLLLCGPTGVGKTYLSVCLALEIGADDCLFLPAHQLLDDMRASYGGGEGSLAARAAGVPYLILDDVSAIRITDWVEDRLYALLNARWNAGLPMLASSNLEPGELRARLGDGIASRIIGMCGRVIIVEGPDGRLTQGGTR